MQRINTARIFGSVLRLGFHVWKNPKRYTSQKKTSHWLQHVTVTFRLTRTSTSTNVCLLSPRFTNSYFIFILGPREEVPSTGLLLLRRDALILFTHHQTCHSFSSMAWGEQQAWRACDMGTRGSRASVPHHTGDNGCSRRRLHLVAVLS